MGEKFTNYQILSNSISDVAQAVKSLIRTKAYISPPKGGWITAYDQITDYEINYDEISDLAKELSSTLSTVTFAFVVRSGLNFMYLMYDCGRTIDVFCDDPESFGFDQINGETTKAFSGNPGALLRYCLPGTSLDSVNQVLVSSKSGDVEKNGQEAAYQLALFLGIDGYRATSGYSYFEDNSLYNTVDPIIENAEDFLLVQR